MLEPKKEKNKPETNMAAPAPENGFFVSEDLQNGVNNAFKIGARWLEERDVCTFLSFRHEGKQGISSIKDCNTLNEFLAKVRRWTSDPKTTTPWFVLMCTGVVDDKGTAVYSLIAHCAERNQKEGFSLHQKLERIDGRWKPAGQIEFMQRMPNDFFG